MSPNTTYTEPDRVVFLVPAQGNHPVGSLSVLPANRILRPGRNTVLAEVDAAGKTFDYSSILRVVTSSAPHGEIGPGIKRRFSTAVG